MRVFICCKDFSTVTCITFETSLFAVAKVHQFLSWCNPCLMFPCEFNFWEGEKMTFHFCIHAIFYQNLREPWRLSPFICSGTGAKLAFREVELKQVNIRKPLGPTALKNICPYNNPLIWGTALHASGGQVSSSQHQFQPRLCLPWFISPRLIKVFLSISVGGLPSFLCNVA